MSRLKLTHNKITPDNQAAIVRISGHSNYSYVHMKDGKTHVFPSSIAQYASRLPDFVRIHKQHLVNPAFVQAAVRIDSKQAYITLQSGEILPIAKRRINAVMGQLIVELDNRKKYAAAILSAIN